MLDGRLVDFEKLLRFQVEHPHRVGVVVEEQAVLPLAVAQFLLRAPAVGHVAAIENNTLDLRVGQPVVADKFQAPPLASLVFVAELELGRALRIVQRELKNLLRARQILGVNARENAFTQQFLRRVTQHVFHGSADVGQICFAVDDAQDVERIFRECAEILFAPGQFHFRLPQLGARRGFL